MKRARRCGATESPARPRRSIVASRAAVTAGRPDRLRSRPSGVGGRSRSWTRSRPGREGAEGTDRAFDRLCAVGEAQRSLEAYEDKLAELARARAKLRRLRAAQKRAAGDRQERAGIDGRTQEPCGSTECSAAGGAAESAGLVEQLTQPAERFVRPGAESGPRAGGHSGPRGPDYASRDARARPDSASPGKRPDASHRILCLC
jgi:hypothetical protein